MNGPVQWKAEEEKQVIKYWEFKKQNVSNNRPVANNNAEGQTNKNKTKKQLNDQLFLKMVMYPFGRRHKFYARDPANRISVGENMKKK